MKFVASVDKKKEMSAFKRRKEVRLIDGLLSLLSPARSVPHSAAFAHKLPVMASSISYGDQHSGIQAGTINGPVNTEFYQHAPFRKSQKVYANCPANENPSQNDDLALTYCEQGRWDAAEELEVQVLEIGKKQLGADHPSTLTSMNNLAFTYCEQGRWNAAEELQVQVLEIRKKQLGAEHPDTLTSMNNLAHTWKQIGRRSEAIRLMEECVQLQKRVLGADHPRTLMSRKSLAEWKAEQEDVVSSV
jgi:tetratricopeptide (TPR) repeat protein